MSMLGLAQVALRVAQRLVTADAESTQQRHCPECAKGKLPPPERGIRETDQLRSKLRVGVEIERLRVVALLKAITEPNEANQEQPSDEAAPRHSGQAPIELSAEHEAAKNKQQVDRRNQIPKSRLLAWVAGIEQCIERQPDEHEDQRRTRLNSLHGWLAELESASVMVTGVAVRAVRMTVVLLFLGRLAYGQHLDLEVKRFAGERVLAVDEDLVAVDGGNPNRRVLMIGAFGHQLHADKQLDVAREGLAGHGLRSNVLTLAITVGGFDDHFAAVADGFTG